MKTLIKISLFFISVCLFQSIAAQIVYTDIDPDTTVIAPKDSWGMYFVDLNKDGTNDFLLNHHNMKISSNYQKIEMCTEHDKAQILCDTSYLHYPLSLSASEQISVNSQQWYNPSGLMILLNENGVSGYWLGVNDKYLGVRVRVGLAWYYGWIRLNIPADAGSYTVKDFAYNSTQNTFILAGDNGSNSIQSQNGFQKNFTIYPSLIHASENIFFSESLQNYDAKLYDSFGKLIEQRTDLNGNSYFIQTNCLKPGLYVFRIEKNGIGRSFRICVK
jgi:hypothetical protein